MSIITALVAIATRQVTQALGDWVSDSTAGGLLPPALVGDWWKPPSRCRWFSAQHLIPRTQMAALISQIIPKELMSSSEPPISFAGEGRSRKEEFNCSASKGGHSGLTPWKTVCPNPGGFGEEFYSNSSRVADSPLLINVLNKWNYYLLRQN